MPATINTRPQAIDLEFYPGQAITLTLTFPAGYLSTRAFKAFLGGRTSPGVELTCTEDTDELEIVADSSDTVAFDFPAEFTLVPFTAPSTYGSPIFVGTWTPGTEGPVAATTASYVVRTPDEVAVTVESLGVPGPAGSTGATGAAGTNGTDGKTILYGTAAPTTEGVDGDFYIRTTTNFLYGPKAAGSWPAGTSLVGPVATVVAGSGITVDATDPANPIVAATGGGGGGLLAFTQYDPGTMALYDTTSSTFADIDAANLAVVFTVPSSGNVLVRLTGSAKTASNNEIGWGIREGSTDIAQGLLLYGASSALEGHCSMEFAITGLTPTDVLTYKASHARVFGTGTVTTRVGGTSVQAGPFVLTVTALP